MAMVVAWGVVAAGAGLVGEVSLVLAGGFVVVASGVFLEVGACPVSALS